MTISQGLVTWCPIFSPFSATRDKLRGIVRFNQWMEFQVFLQAFPRANCEVDKTVL
jgi:hypothetical protein